jgi:hypothetical protein
MKDKSEKKFYTKLAYISLFVITGLLIVWQMKIKAKNEIQSDIISETPTPTQMSFEDCTKAHSQQIARISEFIHGDYFLDNAYMEKFENGYFVAAEIYPSKYSDQIEAVGVWFVSGESFQPKTPYRMNYSAKIATPNLSMARTTDLGYDMDIAEAQFVDFCARQP